MRIATLSLLLAACGASVPPPATPPADPGPPISFSVERAALLDVVRMLNRITGRPVVIGARVTPIADCIELSIASSEPITVDHAIRLVGHALADSGVRVEDTADAIVIRAVEGATLPACESGRAVARHTLPTDSRPILREPPEPAVAPAIDGIRRVSDTRFVLTRAALESLLDTSPGGVVSSARIIPHQENGQVVGIRIYGIRRASALGRMGLQNGDTIRTVNGHDISSPDTALEAYAAVRSSDRMTVALTRRGQPMEIEYAIVESLPE